MPEDRACMATPRESKLGEGVAMTQYHSSLLLREHSIFKMYPDIVAQSSSLRFDEASAAQPARSHR